jgi:hypothetical protein
MFPSRQGVARSLALLIALSVGSPVRTEPAERTVPPAPTANAALATSAPATVAASEIGWAVWPGRPAAPAYNKNRDALARHRQGDHAGALAGFEAAIAIAPDYAMARFNRACALSRLGRTADAAAEIEGLLRTDLIEFGRRLELDKDLVALRSSRDGARLEKYRASVVAAYASAVTHGIPALTYDAERVMAGAAWVQLPKAQRGGVWLGDVRRFVALTPRHDDAFGIVWSSETATTTVLYGAWQTQFYQVFPVDFGVEVWSLREPGTVVASLEHAEGSFARLFPATHASNVDGEDTYSWSMSFGSIGVRPLAGGVELEVEPYTKSPDRSTMRVEVTSKAPAVATSPNAGTTKSSVAMLTGAVVVARLPAGYTLADDGLIVPGRTAPIPIGRTYPFRSLVVTPDGSAAFLLSVVLKCTFGNEDGIAHRLVRVDLRSFEVREVSQGPTGAALAVTAEGLIFVQVEGATKRVSPSGVLSDAGLPTWLHLAIPIYEPDCTM